MPRGRHRQTPPLHRMLSPATIAVVAVLCAGSAWLVGSAAADSAVLALRGLVTAAAGTAVVGAVLLRAWDREAGRRVCELRAARARDEWQAEDRAAELETELEEAHELCAALQTRLREKHTNLARLRTEHAALLRRYATAETERASALEGRRLLAIETDSPARALTATATDHRDAAGAPTSLSYLQADEAVDRLARNAARQQRQRDEEESEFTSHSRTATSVDRSQAPSRAPFQAPAVAPSRDTERRRGSAFDFFGKHAAAEGTRSEADADTSEDADDSAEADTFGGDGADSWAPAGRKPAAEQDVREESEYRAAGKVIDLGAHGVAEDEGEGDDEPRRSRLDIAELRSAIS